MESRQRRRQPAIMAVIMVPVVFLLEVSSLPPYSSCVPCQSSASFITGAASSSSSAAATGWKGTPACWTLKQRRERRRPGTITTAMKTGAGGLFKGPLGVLEWANGLVPQRVLVKGARTTWNLIWKTMMAELAPQSSDGSYVRPTYGFRSQLGTPEFPLEDGRYHIYVGNACPWCHRVTVTHALKGLSQGQVSYSYMEDDPERASRGGWAFNPPHRPDPVFNCNDLREVYERCSPGYVGRCTAPVMVDTKTGRIVNNESSDLIRLLNMFHNHHHHQAQAPPPPAAAGSSGNERGPLSSSSSVDLYPPEPPGLRARIDEVNNITYTLINNGVYRAGFATSQSAYDRAVKDVVEGLQWVEARLAETRFLAGDRVTEADVRLYPTIIRFDAVYASLFLRGAAGTIRHGHSSSNGGYGYGYPRLWSWMKTLSSLRGVKDTIDMPGLVRSYYVQLFPLNPSGIVPPAPPQDDGDDGDGALLITSSLEGGDDALFFFSKR